MNVMMLKKALQRTPAAGACAAGAFSLAVSCSQLDGGHWAEGTQQAQAVGEADGGFHDAESSTNEASANLSDDSNLTDLERLVLDNVTTDSADDGRFAEALQGTSLHELRELVLTTDSVGGIALEAVIMEIARRDVPTASVEALRKIESNVDGIAERLVPLTESDNREMRVLTQRFFILSGLAKAVGFLTPPEGQDILDRLLVNEDATIRGTAEVAELKRSGALD